MKAHSRGGEGPFAGKCAWCGKEFGAWSPQAEYCSVAHKQAHYRWRSKVAKYAHEANQRIDKLIMYLKQGGVVGENAGLALSNISAHASGPLSTYGNLGQAKKAKESK